jgi:hypothetical protein
MKCASVDDSNSAREPALTFFNQLFAASIKPSDGLWPKPAVAASNRPTAARIKVGFIIDDA